LTTTTPGANVTTGDRRPYHAEFWRDGSGGGNLGRQRRTVARLPTAFATRAPVNTLAAATVKLYPHPQSDIGDWDRHEPHLASESLKWRWTGNATLTSPLGQQHL